MTRKPPVRVAVIGCGLIARRAHLTAYVAAPEAELVDVVSGHREKAEDVARQFGNRACSPPGRKRS